MLTRDQIVSVYRQVLEREPSEEEIRAQLATVPDLDSLLGIALGSEEYAERLRRRGMNAAQTPTMVNTFHPDLAEWTLQPGTRSADEIAIVGREGWLFLCGGTNATLAQYVGEAQMEPGWLKEWRQVIQQRDLRLPEQRSAVPRTKLGRRLVRGRQRWPANAFQQLLRRR